MKRRDFVVGAGSFVAGLALAGRVDAAEEPGTGGHKQATTPAPALTKVAATAAACEAAGQDCIRHCVDLLGQGDASLRACLESALAMSAVCGALAKVASYATTATLNVRALAGTCAKFCAECSEACKPHAEHHAVCKACMDHCDECETACVELAKSEQPAGNDDHGATG
jgi:Cys-rich four helix bundle protein (predicted Tat secretion target)